MRALGLSSLSRKSFFSNIAVNCSLDLAESNSRSSEGRSNTDTLQTTREEAGGGLGLTFGDFGFGRGYCIDPVVKELSQLSLFIYCLWAQFLSFFERAIVNEELP